MSNLMKSRISRSLLGLLALATLTVGVLQLTTTAHLSGWIVSLLLATVAALVGFRVAGWLGTKPDRN